MGQRIVYKNGNSKTCGYTEASRLVAEQGWSWTESTPAKPAKKKTAKPKKAKVEVDAVELKPVEDFGSITEDNSKEIDLGNINEEK
tara:strand:+ start:304 stop:561 length:258 start_codon:yes stop_codon:yes gene_type:complete